MAFDTGVIFLACAIVASLFQRYAGDAYMVCQEWITAGCFHR